MKDNFRQNDYRRAQAGFRVAVTTADFRWMQLQYDDFFFYNGTPWRLVGESKGAGVILVHREPIGGVEVAPREKSHER